MHSLVALLFAGCSPPDASAPATDAPTAYVGEEPVAAPPSYGADAAGAALDGVLDGLFTYNADVLFRSYDEVMAYADDVCPPIARGDGGAMWDVVDCTSGAGAVYSGFVSEFVGDQGGAIVRRMRGEATIDLPDGRRMTVAGEAATDVIGARWSSGVHGVMRYDGPAALGTWVEDGVDLNLDYELEEKGDGEGIAYATVDGSVAGFVGEVTAISFSDFRVQGTPEWPCAAEPAGTVKVRDAAGVWGEATFGVTGSMEDGWAIDAEACDGCAPLTFGGEALFDVCVDTAPLLAQEAPAW